MDKIKYLLTKLAEEGAEVTQACTKALCFGLDDIYPTEGITVFAKIKAELNDMMAIVELLQSTGLDFEDYPDGKAIAAKKAKVAHWMTYSRERGHLT